MKVFLAGIIQGSLVEATIHQQDWREPIKRALGKHLPGANVYCHYTRHPNSIAYDLPRIRTTLGEGVAQASRCDLLVAYVPSASMGTAIEMYEAARNGAIVLTISPLAANWVIRAYSDRIFEDLETFERFLGSPDFRALVESKGRCAP